MHARIISFVSPLVRASPLRHERFRHFYAGSVGTALGYTMQATVAAWLMATLTPSAIMVALVQTASTAPSLLFGLIAGTLADIVDRRKVVLSTQILLLTATLILGAATLAGMIGPIALLLLTFLVGVGFTFYMPAQQALVNDLVPRTELPRAVALSAVAFNLARAVGPALAGAIAAWLGTGSALLASALFFVWMIVALYGWPKPVRSIPGVPETLLAGVRSGLRYLQHSAPLRAFVIRNLSFSLCASALWALLPLIARDQLQLGAGGFGLLVGFFGTGAVVGALWIPRHLQKVSLNTVVTGGYLLWAVAAVVVAFAPVVVVAIVGTAAAGAAWVSVFASLSAGTQTSAPAWVRARAVATNLVATQASLALGSVVWGVLASAAGTRVALSVSAGIMLLLFVLSRRVRVELGNEADVTMGVQPPELSIAVQPMPDDGPVLIQIEYRVEPKHHRAFLHAIRAIEAIRRRNGAASWRVYRDVEDAERFVERFVITSWAEYTRQRSRMTVKDRELQDRVMQLNRPGTPIRVSRLIGVATSEAGP
ncbi:MAG TPA: MFS transporter [Burkholderiales bacterium]|nr:MFS transporter [Burkholderiales bacterium]